MTKADLRTGMVITCRNGNEYLILKDCVPDILPSTCTGSVPVNINANNHYIPFDEIAFDLTDGNGDAEWDVIKVEALKERRGIMNPQGASRRLLWERPEKKKYTYAQLKEILGEEFEIVKE